MTDIPENPNDEGDLKRSLGPIHLISLGIGCIIGAGIFVLTGAPPALCRPRRGLFPSRLPERAACSPVSAIALFASMIPVAGSAYTYTYATLGKLEAWIIGWNLVLEYLAASSTVAVGWSGYFNDFMSHIGMPIPAMFDWHARRDALVSTNSSPPARSSICPPWLLVAFHHHRPGDRRHRLGQFQQRHGGDQAYHRAGGDPSAYYSYIVPANHTPFVPTHSQGAVGHFGWTGVFRATGVLFFSYIGFDAVRRSRRKRPRIRNATFPWACWDL